MGVGGWLTLVAAAVLWLGCAGNADAATKTWVGGSGTWDVPANWKPAGVPSSTDDAVIDSGAPEVSAADATVGSLELSSGLSVTGDHTLTVSGSATLTTGANVALSQGTLRLDGTTVWSAGRVQITDAGALEDAGRLQVTGAGVGVDASFGGGARGRIAFSVLAGGVTEVSGSLAVASELEDDGTVRVLDGGSLVQSGEVAAPADSGGVFEAQGSGVLALSSVSMGAGSRATGSGTIRFAGGTSHVLAGAGYAAGITDLGDGGVLDLQADANTGALRFSGSGTRRGGGTLTVGGGTSSLGKGTFSDGGVTAFSSGSQVSITDTVTLQSTTAGPTLQLGGSTVWSAGRVQVDDAGVLEDAGRLQVTGAGVGVDASFGGGARGPRGLRNTAGTIDVRAGATLALAGDYAQGPNAALRAGIASATQYGRLTSGGTAALDGTLQLVTGPGFVPAATDTFRIIDAGTRAGTFAAVATQATANERYVPEYDTTGLTLAVAFAPVGSAPPPAPGAAPAPAPAPAAGPPPPVTGKTVNVAAERGTVTVRLPNGTTIPIDDATQIVTGSIVDTRAGAVRLSVSAGGKLQTGVFSDGMFRVTQSTGSHPVTELQLVEKLDCPRAAGARAATKHKKKRSLWGDAKGSFRTRGLYGSAVNTGTKWLTEDTCDGTLFRVARGVIRVTPNGSRRSVLVRAGRRYLVRRKR